MSKDSNAAERLALDAQHEPYVIVSTKWTRAADPYVTFWRSARAGYCWPLDWAGRYSAAEAEDITEGSEDQFAVPLIVAIRHSQPPKPGLIDGDAGPVVPRRRLNKLQAESSQ